MGFQGLTGFGGGATGLSQAGGGFESYSALATSMTNSQGAATLANIYLMFDGSGTPPGVTTGWGGGSNGAGAATVSFTDPYGVLQWSSTIEILGNMGATSGQVGSNTGFMKVNGYDIVPEMKTANQYYLGSAITYVDITSKVGSSGTLSSIALEWIGGVANPWYGGIKLDGVVLVD